jgi:hypothetical protein
MLKADLLQDSPDTQGVMMLCSPLVRLRFRYERMAPEMTIYRSVSFPFKRRPQRSAAFSPSRLTPHTLFPSTSISTEHSNFASLYSIHERMQCLSHGNDEAELV